MDNSVYIVLSRQLTRFEDMTVTANNIANISTPGYNGQKLSFSQYLVDAGNQKKDAYSNDPVAYRDTSNGALQNTNNPLDLAITGPGYFQVQTPLGTRFTKAGNFQISADGTLVTNAGYPVLGPDGSPVSLPTNSKKIEINNIGQVTADGQSVGQVGLVEFQNEQALSRLGNTLYDSKTPPQPATTAHMVQGVLEASNVNGVTELTKMMDISHSTTDLSKFIEVVYDLERKTSSTLTETKSA